MLISGYVRRTKDELFSNQNIPELMVHTVAIFYCPTVSDSITLLEYILGDRNGGFMLTNEQLDELENSDTLLVNNEHRVPPRWTCTMCSFQNPSATAVCSMCQQGQRPPAPPKGSFVGGLPDAFDQDIYRHLEWLIDHQVEIFKNDKDINEDDKFNSWCLQKQGIIQLRVVILSKLPKSLRHKFVSESPDNTNDCSLNWSTWFNLFPNCNKVWVRGLFFNNYLCEQFVNFLCSGDISSGKYKMDGIVFSCTDEDAWKLWVASAKKHSSIIKQMGWVPTASPPRVNQALGVIETGRVSFVKRNLIK